MTRTAIALSKLAAQVRNDAENAAYLRGAQDFARGRRQDHPPYGFSDLRRAWKKGWVAASKRRVIGGKVTREVGAEVRG